MPPARPEKVIAVHLNYRSRATQRGRTPAFPSYFLKPPTTVAASGDPVVRPAGCELLAFEGEIALVIGEAAHRVAPEAAWSCVQWVTAANDFGVYDLRYADRGANLRSKGIDGYTPLGPRFLDARDVDPGALRLRTWLDGDLVQEAVTGDELLFGFEMLVADLSRLMTLHPGDVILTGTPAGSSVVGPGSVVEVEVAATSGAASTGRLVSPVVASGEELSPIGAMPRADDAARAAAEGSALGPRPLSPDIVKMLSAVSTATLASQLRRRGHDDCMLDGLSSTRPDLKMVGRARTLRYVPFRADLFRARGGGMNAQKRAVEAIGPGEVLVIDARGVSTAGTIGDLLALRAVERGATGIVTDGAVRDAAALGALEIPTYHSGTHPAVLGRRHVPWETDVAIACAGVAVEPGDVVVGDGDGVVVLPEPLVEGLACDAAEQERQERFIATRLRQGAPVTGLYPLGEDWQAAYAAWCAQEAPNELR